MIISGKDKNKRGKITRVFTKKGAAVIGGLNLYKKHAKRKSEKEQSQIVTIEKPLNISRLMLVCPHCNQATRIGFMIEKEKKMRFCKKCKKAI